MTILIYGLVGLLAGTLSGLVGIGGGIVIVPLLVYLFGFSQQTAQGTTVALLSLPVGILGALQYYRHGYVDLKVVGLIALGFVLGSFLGAKFAVVLPTLILKRLFGGLLLVIGFRMLLESF